MRDVHGRPTSVPGGGERGGPASARRTAEAGPIEFAVGAVRAVPTFRLGRDGQLFPLYDDPPWRKGANTALCRRGDAHATPAPGCRCGFYAYGDLAWVGAQPPSRSALAVVALWGEIDAIRPAPVLEPPDSDPLGASRRRSQPPCQRPAGRPARTYRRPRTHG